MEIKTHYASFSEAIREGAAITRAGTPTMWIDEHGGTCALGAGAIALGLDPADEDYSILTDTYPYLENDVRCPECDNKFGTELFAVLTDLFDNHKWTREAIADWLETEEEKLGYVTVIDNELSLATTTVESQESFAGQEVLV